MIVTRALLTDEIEAFVRAKTGVNTNQGELVLTLLKSTFFKTEICMILKICFYDDNNANKVFVYRTKPG